MVETVDPALDGGAAGMAGPRDEDLAALRRAAQAAPDDVEAQFRLGRALVDRRMAAEAVPALQEVVRRQSDHGPALVLLGAALIRLGKPAPGQAALQAALQRTPATAAAQFDLGNRLREANCHAEAVTAFDAAIRSGPETASAHYNRGICLRALDRLDEAVAAYERAIELDRGHAKAHNNLGNCLRTLGRMASAERALRRAIDLAPEMFEAHYNLARVLSKSARHGEAVVAFRRALRLRPDHAEALVRLGVVLQEIGQLDAAMACYRQAIEISPHLAVAHVQLAQIDPTPLDSAGLQRLEAALTDARHAGAQAQNLHFALAYRYEQAGEFGRSFQHLIEANRLKRGRMQYDLDADIRDMEAIERTFDAEFFARHAVPGDPSRLPIFVVGMPRSGTTLIEQILASHSLVRGAGEVPALVQRAHRILDAAVSGDRGAAARALSPAVLQEAAQGYLEQLRRAAPEAPRVVDKMLTNFKYVGLIRLMLPNARIVHARRHPIDTCLSVFRRLFSGGLAFSYDLSELGAYYRAYSGLMRHWHRVLPGVVLDVQYEDLVDDQRGVTERLLAHCGLAWEDACLRFYETQRAVQTASLAQVRRPIYRSSAGAWKRYGEHLLPLIEALGEEVDRSDLEALRRTAP